MPNLSTATEVTEQGRQGGRMPIVVASNLNFRLARRMLDLTQVEVAEAIKISQGELSNFEKSVRPLSKNNRKKLTTFLQRRLEARGFSGGLEKFGIA